MKTLIASTSLVLLAALPPGAATAGAPTALDTLTRWSAGEWTVWRIDRPTVHQAATAYPSIRLQPGDALMLDAGGCLRTDSGWTPYLEGGRISIPGLTAGSVPLQEVLRQELRIPDSAEGGALRLEFAGERSSRGYAGERPRAGACAGQADAYVYVGVRRAASLVTAYGPAPMDLVWSGASDPNGIWQNPKWGRQVTVPGSLAEPKACFNVPGWFSNPLCTVQSPSIDEPSGFTWLICYSGSTTPIEGHVNWYAGTYTGPISWIDQSWPDMDYNMGIPPPNRNGLTVANPTRIKGEFDARETIDNFVTPWWKSFRGASDATKSAMVNGKYAIMSGLIGTDCEHDCYSEVHPVWALAIRIKDDPNDEVWAVFARNWGNEGYCSRYQHLVNFYNNRFTFKLPWRWGASSVALASGTGFYANKSGMSWWWGAVPGDRVSLTVQLLSPYSYGRVHGEVHFRWTGALMARGEEAAAAEPEVTFVEKSGGEGERWLNELVEKLDPEQRAVLEKELGPQRRGRDAAPLAQGRNRAEKETVLAGTVPVTQVLDLATAAENARRTLALRKAYGRPLPGEKGAALEKALEQQKQKE